uniref:Uncharacterized protein n=1 Tax=Anopheles funestus TaxID=62324 RepID=A0A182RWY9_ANOFN
MIFGILIYVFIQQVSTGNDKDYDLRITKFQCIDTPYQRSVLHYCKTVVRRNQPTILNLSITVPESFNFLKMKFLLEYKFTTFRPLFFDLEKELCEFLSSKTRDPASEIAYKVVFEKFKDIAKPCPHGNRTYSFEYWVDPQNFPKSVPAGDYRLTTIFSFKDNVNMIKLHTYVDIEDNSSRSFQLRLLKILCVDQPYKRTIVHYCKTVLRRNQPTLLNISITIPEVFNICYVTIKIEYKFNEYQPFLFDTRLEGCKFLREKPIDPLSLYLYGIFKETLPMVVTPCPHGNRTYDILWTMDERLSPRSVPAGDYRVTAHWETESNETMIKLQIYCAVRLHRLSKRPASPISSQSSNSDEELAQRVKARVLTSSELAAASEEATSGR